ncbi:hypothetical protein [Nocardia cyriacigeorgica]|uniref:hypothetical protein n=1 Tax=Nocardia cyriacigeorgica TaxID=135487 RepID=UPI0024569203|nr:hypothetical protein [Nocardia cyriacigeorgica]
MTMNDEISRWQYLSDEAKAGRLSIDDSVAKACHTAIQDQINVYKAARQGIEEMAVVTELGEFACGQELAKLFGLKAVDAEGNGDLDTALRDHIRVLELMGDTIKATLDRLQEQDSTNSQGYNGV